MEASEILKGVEFDAGTTPVLYNFDGSICKSETDSVVYRKDNGKRLGVVGSRYVIEDHKVNLIQVAGMMEEFGKFTISNKLEGGRIFSKFTLDDMPIMSGDEKAKPVVTVLNSYDGSKPFGMMFGFFRLICSNGMVIGNVLHKVSKLHTVSLQADGVRDRLITTIKAEITHQNSLYEKAYSVLSSKGLINEEALKKNIPERLVEEAMGENYAIELQLTGKANAWTQFQAFTRTITRKDATETTKELLNMKVLTMFQNTYAFA